MALNKAEFIAELAALPTPIIAKAVSANWRTLLDTGGVILPNGTSDPNHTTVPQATLDDWATAKAAHNGTMETPPVNAHKVMLALAMDHAGTTLPQWAIDILADADTEGQAVP